MPILERVQEEVAMVAEEYGMAEDRAFSYWYLTEFREMSYEAAEPCVVDGPWDGGRDVEIEDDTFLTICQMKWTENPQYAVGGFNELIEYVSDNRNEIARRLASEGIFLNLVLATSARITQETKQGMLRRKTGISRILTNAAREQGFDDYSAASNIELQVHDITWIATQYNQLSGIDLELQLVSEPIVQNGSVLSLIDARGLQDYVNDDRLFDMNIRKNLGVRNKVNTRIFSSLTNPTLHSEDVSLFWELNNGIVCICDSFEYDETSRICEFQEFSIVNGAQTTSTIAKFLEERPESREIPVPVVAKIIPVAGNFDRAAQLTVSSNSQSAINNQDLRAIGKEHRILEAWFGSADVFYQFRRGGRVPRGARKVKMKDLAQAMNALLWREPQISFSRMGSIFSNTETYNRIFNEEWLTEKEQDWSEVEVTGFVNYLLTIHDMIPKVRGVLKSMVDENIIDKKWKSASFHLSYLIWKWYYAICTSEGAKNPNNLRILSEFPVNTIRLITNSLVDRGEALDWEIPRDLKNNLIKDAIDGFGERNRISMMVINEFNDLEVPDIARVVQA